MTTAHRGGVFLPARISRALACLTVAIASCVGAAADLPEGIRKIESEAASCHSAAAAARVYAVALTSSNLSEKDRAAAEARREHWLKLADEGRRRLGREWLTHDEREAKEKEAERFVEQSFEMLRLGNGKLAEDHLKEASRRYLESGRADMILGLIYAMVVGDNRRAATHFKEVIEREPGNAYAYNNFAITALASRKYSVAIRYLRRALELMPDSQELSDNLAVTLGLVGTGQLVLPEKELEEVSRLYRFAIHDLGLQPYQPPTQGQAGGAGGSSFGGGMRSASMGSEGFAGGASLPPSGPGGGYGSGSGGPGGYGSGALGGEGMGPGGPGGQGDAGAAGYAFFTPFGRPLRGPMALDPATVDRLLDDPDEMVTEVWSGTGVTVGDGYVLTTIDVVGDATKVLVRKPGSVGVFMEADVVATSDETGLVLLDCMDLDVPAMPVAAAGAGAAGSKVLVGGFAGGLSERLTGTMTAAKDVPRGGKAAEGDADLIVAFPKRETADACGFGGIVLAASGELVGVVEGTVSPGAEGSVAEQTGSAGGGYGVGAGAAIIRKFLEEEMDDDIAEVSSKPSSWKDVVDAASESAVFLYAKKVRPGKPKPPTQQFAGGAPGAFGGGFGGNFGGGYGVETEGEMMEEEGAGYGSSPLGYGSMPPGTSPQGYGSGSQPPGLSPASMGAQSPGSSPQSYGSGSQPPGSSPQGYGSQPPGSSPGGYGSQPPGSSPGSYGSQPPGSSPGSYGSQPPGSSPQGYGSQPPGSGPQSYGSGSQPPSMSPQGYGSQPPGSSPGSYGSQPPGSSPGSYGSQPPGPSPQGYGSQPPGSGPQSYGSGSFTDSPPDDDPTAGENAEMEAGEEGEGEPSEGDGASFAPSDYPLAEQTVLGGTLTLKLPSGFEPMSSQMLQTKYPGANRPTLVYTNSTGSINIAINHTQNAVQPDQLKQLHQALDSATRQQVPDGNWRFSGFQHYAGREWVQLEFLSDAADTKIENLMVATSVDGRMLVVSFNVTQELAGDWLPVGKEVIQSLVAEG